MQLDPSIIMGSKPAQFENPANQLAKLLQVQEMQQMGRAREMQMQDAQEERASRNRLTSLLSQYGDAQDLPEQLTKGGFIDQANTVRKNRTEAQNAQTALSSKQFEQAKQRLEIMGQTFGYVRQNPTPENAMSAIQFLTQNGIMTPEQAQQASAQIQADPSKVGQLADMAFRSVLSAQQQLPKIETRDTGGAVQTFKVDPVTGQQSTVASVAKTQSPDSIATDRREASKPAPESKPLPGSALKMVQESLDAIGISSSINADLASVEKQIADKKLSFGPISNMANSALNSAGMSTEGSRNFASFKSTLERLRNESLRLNTGVQTDGDAQRAWNELFQNINDTDLVKQRLGEIQRINKRGAELHQLRADSVRANYGQGPVDAGQYKAQPAALNGGEPSKIMSMADVKATAKARGVTEQQVIDAAKAKGFTIK